MVEDAGSGTGDLTCTTELLTMVGCVQVLAVDLLNPSAAAEARKHKLKVCLDSTDSPVLQQHS
jgi:hypothetical protein